MQGLLTAVLFCLAVTAVTAQLPIPAVQRGYTLAGSRGSTVTVEVFYDLLCPDSMDNWPVIHKLLADATFSAAQLGVVMNVFPLPYHHHATYVATGYRAYMARETSMDRIMLCTSELFKQQGLFKTSAADYSETALGEKIALFFKAECGVEVGDAFNNATTHQHFRGDVVLDWKYAAARTVSGTPIFIVNGVMDNAVGAFVSSEQWEHYIGRLLAGSPQFPWQHMPPQQQHTSL